MATRKFEVDQLTDAGPVKAVNEDSFLVRRHDALPGGAVLVAVADGVGGLDHGENASATAVGALANWWETVDWASPPPSSALLQDLLMCAQTANRQIYQSAQQAGQKRGTTLSALLLTDSAYHIFHVGDSRVYRIDGSMLGEVEQLTEDHVAILPKLVGDATVMKTYLTECLGFSVDFGYQQRSGRHQAGELYLVCSDGVYKTQEDWEMARLVRRRKKHLDRACRELVCRAKDKGETDNLTAAVVRIIN